MMLILIRKLSMLRISPLPSRRMKKIPIGVLTSDGNVIGETGAKILYCGTALPALRLAQRDGGKALIIRTRGSTRWIRFQVGEREIIPGVATPDIDQLIGFRDYCHDLGIQAGSLQQMGFRLMRYSLAGYFDTCEGTEIPFSKFPPGARAHFIPGIWTRVSQVDLTGAYLWGIGQFTPAISHSEYRRISLSELRDNPGSWGLVSFRISDQVTHGPLPEISPTGVTIYPTVPGEWSKPTLLSSFDLLNCEGCEVRISRGWIANQGITKPFSAFMYLVNELRSTYMRGVAKQAGNTLWGAFLASGDSAIVEFVPGELRSKIRPLPLGEPLCRPIGNSVLSMIRSRLYSEGVTGITFHAYTDGYITKTRALKGMISSDELGGWRIIGEFKRVEVLGSSWLKITRLDGTEIYKLSGRNATGDNASRVFAHHREREMKNASLE